MRKFQRYYEMLNNANLVADASQFECPHKQQRNICKIAGIVTALLDEWPPD